MKKIKIAKYFSLFLTFVCIGLWVYNSLNLFAYRKSYTPFDCTSYNYDDASVRSWSIFGANNLEVDKNGNIYLGCADGIMIYDSKGTPLQHIFIEKDFLFKLESNKLKIISPYSYSFHNDNKKQVVYLFETAIYIDDFHIYDDYSAEIDYLRSMFFEQEILNNEFKKINTDLKFHDYAVENAYDLNLVYNDGKNEYRYGFYGDVLVNNQKIIHLKARVLPMAEEIPGTIVLFFATAFILLKLFEIGCKITKRI